MIVVLDTSAAIEVVLNRNKAKSIQEVMIDANWIVTVDLFISELCNVFWKYYTFEDLPINICKKSIERAIDFIDNFVISKDLFQEAFTLACQINHPVYDALYLICARRKDATLITLDRKMHTASKKIAVKSEFF